MKTMDFSETVAANNLKVGRSRHLIEFMKVIVRLSLLRKTILIPEYEGRLENT